MFLCVIELVNMISRVLKFVIRRLYYFILDVDMSYDMNLIRSLYLEFQTILLHS
jgi:hypothetical protein